VSPVAAVRDRRRRAAPAGRRPYPRPHAGRGSRPDPHAHPRRGGPFMKFRAVRPNALGTPDAIVFPLSSAGATPSGLPRAVKTVVDRIAKAETGAARLYGVTTHHADPR